MKFYSPLRYPGGKNNLSKFISLLCKKNKIHEHYVEPYAGGAAVALYLLINGYVKKITINDLDRGIYAFWYSILNNTDKFCKKIKYTQITLENWYKFKRIRNKINIAELFDLGFATFFLNRVNRSGIIDGGIIGGKEQKGKYKMYCRFNKDTLIKRINLIASYKKNIKVYNMDALELVNKLKKEDKNSNTLFYLDPPYYSKGPALYMNYYNENDHIKISKEIQKMKEIKWVISYDNVPKIVELYKSYRRKYYEVMYNACKIRKEKEVLFFSNNLVIPREIAIGK